MELNLVPQLQNLPRCAVLLQICFQTFSPLPDYCKHAFAFLRYGKRCAGLRRNVRAKVLYARPQGSQRHSRFLCELSPMARQYRIDRVAAADFHGRRGCKRRPEHCRNKIVAWRKAAAPPIV